MLKYKRSYKENHEQMIHGSTIEPIKNDIPYIKGDLAVAKIECDAFKEYNGLRTNIKIHISGTGSFIKFRDPKNHKRFKYFFMTCEHVIQKEIINLGNKECKIKYFFEQYSIKILLNKKERFIKEYKTDQDLDITLIEIKQDDNIPPFLFLEPKYSINENNYEELLNQDIIVHQFPLATEQSKSEGWIKEIDGNKLYHTASTQGGSSGSPLILKNESEIFGIHYGRGDNVNEHNNANFIYFLVDDVRNIQEVDYRYESDINEDKYNYTSMKCKQIKKVGYSKVLDKDNYNITLEIYGNNEIKVKIENTETNDVYETFVTPKFKKKLEEELEYYQKLIYTSKIEEYANYLNICFEGGHTLKVEKIESDPYQNEEKEDSKQSTDDFKEIDSSDNYDNYDKLSDYNKSFHTRNSGEKQYNIHKNIDRNISFNNNHFYFNLNNFNVAPNFCREKNKMTSHFRKLNLDENSNKEYKEEKKEVITRKKNDDCAIF